MSADIKEKEVTQKKSLPTGSVGTTIDEAQVQKQTDQSEKEDAALVKTLIKKVNGGDDKSRDGVLTKAAAIHQAKEELNFDSSYTNLLIEIKTSVRYADEFIMIDKAFGKTGLLNKYKDQLPPEVTKIHQLSRFVAAIHLLAVPVLLEKLFLETLDAINTPVYKDDTHHFLTVAEIAAIVTDKTMTDKERKEKADAKAKKDKEKEDADAKAKKEAEEVERKAKEAGGVVLPDGENGPPVGPAGTPLTKTIEDMQAKFRQNESDAANLESDKVPTLVKLIEAPLTPDEEAIAEAIEMKKFAATYDTLRIKNAIAKALRALNVPLDNVKVTLTWVKGTP
jgi:hypothetical protein